jgi:hypothetical protein
MNAQQTLTSDNLLPVVCPLQDLVAECPAAKELFDKAADILGYDLLKVRLRSKHCILPRTRRNQQCMQTEIQALDMLGEVECISRHQLS